MEFRKWAPKELCEHYRENEKWNGFYQWAPEGEGDAEEIKKLLERLLRDDRMEFVWLVYLEAFPHITSSKDLWDSIRLVYLQAKQDKRKVPEGECRKKLNKIAMQAKYLADLIKDFPELDYADLFAFYGIKTSTDWYVDDRHVNDIWQSCKDDRGPLTKWQNPLTESETFNRAADILCDFEKEYGHIVRESPQEILQSLAKRAEELSKERDLILISKPRATYAVVTGFVRGMSLKMKEIDRLGSKRNPWLAGLTRVVLEPELTELAKKHDKSKYPKDIDEDFVRKTLGKGNNKHSQ